MPEGLTFEVVCYPWQCGYVKELAGSDIKLTCIPPEAVRDALTENT